MNLKKEEKIVGKKRKLKNPLTISQVSKKRKIIHTEENRSIPLDLSSYDDKQTPEKIEQVGEGGGGDESNKEVEKKKKFITPHIMKPKKKGKGKGAIRGGRGGRNNGKMKRRDTPATWKKVKKIAERKGNNNIPSGGKGVKFLKRVKSTQAVPFNLGNRKKK